MRRSKAYLLFTGSVLVGVAVLGVVSAAAPQAKFPARPITVIVPCGPGGGSDQVAQGVQGPLSKILKPQVVRGSRTSTKGSAPTLDVSEGSLASNA